MQSRQVEMGLDGNGQLETGPKYGRRIMLLAGIFMILIGVVALAAPAATSLVAAAMVGWLFVLAGAVGVFGAFSVRDRFQFLGAFVLGCLTVAAGVILLIYPVAGLLTLTILVAAVLLMTGVAQSVFAFKTYPEPGWGWILASALVSLALGMLIAAGLPATSTVILGIVVGVDFLSTGIALVFFSRLLAVGMES